MRYGAAEPVAALNRIRIEETGEPLVDIRDACPAVEVREDCCPYLRATVAQMLNRAQESLGDGEKLRVSTALRTLAIQRAHWDRYYAQVVESHPNWPLSALRRATNRFFAPYDEKAPPGHCTGGAVDVQLLGAGGEPLDMVSPLDQWAAASTWTDRIGSKARANRMRMVVAMLGAGFSNCREEYWHYSYGDPAWAVRLGVASCPYGLVEPPSVVEARFAGAMADGIERVGDGLWLARPKVTEGGR
ncbi:MAG TPA: M15 family metallopeptidase, partial [Chthonomonadales bacterium]|nr:M15 family metallopeptidase [Chthonomonadales bacterium]